MLPIVIIIPVLFLLLPRCCITYHFTDTDTLSLMSSQFASTAVMLFYVLIMLLQLVGYRHVFYTSAG